MLMKPPLSELLKKIDNRYLLVNIVAKRARDIAAEAEAEERKLNDKPVTMALNDVLEGRVAPHME